MYFILCWWAWNTLCNLAAKSWLQLTNWTKKFGWQWTFITALISTYLTSINTGTINIYVASSPVMHSWHLGKCPEDYLLGKCGGLFGWEFSGEWTFYTQMFGRIHRDGNSCGFFWGQFSGRVKCLNELSVMGVAPDTHAGVQVPVFSCCDLVHPG